MKFERFVFCQFCDDIRTEADGKISLMGVYAGGLQVNSKLPVTLQKLCIVSNIGSPVDNQFQRLKLEIFIDDKSIFSSEVPEDILAEQNKAFRDSSERGHMMTFAVQIASVVIERAGYIRVEVTTESGQFVANRLQITAPHG